MRMGWLPRGILGALGRSYSMLQSTNKGLEKSEAAAPAGTIKPRGLALEPKETPVLLLPSLGNSGFLASPAARLPRRVVVSA